MFLTRFGASTVAIASAMVCGLAVSGCEAPEGEAPEAEAAVVVPHTTPTADAAAKQAEISLLDGAGIRSKIDAAKGTVTVVNFWATWCPPCVEEMPDHVKFFNEYGAKGVTYLSFSADDKSTIEDEVKPFVTKFAIDFPIHVMSVSNPDELEEHLKLGWDGALPTTYLFDTTGAVVNTWVGSVSYDDLVKAVTPLLDDAKSGDAK